MNGYKSNRQKGSALIYILIAIALLAALTAAFMSDSSQQTTSQNAFNAMTELNSQINFIRSAIQECVLTYPLGDATPAFAALNLPNKPYPIMPNNAYLATPAADRFLADVGCPGKPGDSNNHAKIFGGTSGRFLPPPPKLFGPWYYYSGADGVYIFTFTSHTDPYLKTALQKLDDQFSECEADIIEPSGTSVPTDSEGGGCDGYDICFRVWLRTTATSMYLGDLDGDEAACP